MNRRTMLMGLAGAAAPAFAFAAAPAKTYRFASSPGIPAALQSLDVYGGARGGKRPLLAFIHGGGWAIGDKANPAHGRRKAPAFLARGMIFASINYRLSPAVRHPAHVQDVAAAIAWLHAHADQIGADRARFYVMGHSAGAHLAALVATDETRLGAHGLSLSTLKGAIPIDGAGYDVAREIRAARGRRVLTKMYTDAFGVDGSLWADASPITHVAPGKSIPPFLIPYTGALSAAAQAESFAGALRQAGVAARALHAPGQSHTQINYDIGAAGDRVSAAIYEALARWGA